MTKVVANICNSMIKDLKPLNPIICDYVNSPKGTVKLDNPIMSNDYSCQWCRGKAHYTPFLGNGTPSRAWLCANIECGVYKGSKSISSTTTQPAFKRAIEWPLFCEMNSIGNVHHGVKFEDIQQSQGKRDYLFKFGNSPKGCITMHGIKGAGKTFASMATCELFTRRNSYAVFNTQRAMMQKWMAELKGECKNYINSLYKCNLLVIDDFGTTEPPPGYMSFLMDIIDQRLQWTDRGTIITTNLSMDGMSAYCGDSLCDRIYTGMLMKFEEGESRRRLNTL